MPAIGNFSAWVEVDGISLPEYKVEYSRDGRKVTCWIPSEAGKKFQILYKDSHRDTATATKLKVDGVSCQGKISHPRMGEGARFKSTLIHRGMSTSSSMIRPYVFSNCNLVEDELDQLSADVSAVGEIVLSAYEVRLGRYKPRRSLAGFPPLQVYEKAKKGIVHGTQLGEPEPHHQKDSVSTKKLQKVGVFVFKYRPIDVLMANDIAPPPQPPIPSKSSRLSTSSKIVIDLTLDDEDEVSTKPSAEDRNKKRAKKEVKHERSITFDDSVIDLTL